jgi:serine protease Do
MTRKLTAALLVGLAVPAAIAPAGEHGRVKALPVGFYYSAGGSYLGVEIRDVTPDRVSALKLKEERGVEVTMVDQDAAAGKAGLKEHDVILEYNGVRVESEEQLRRLIRETPPGRTVTMGLSRDGAPMNITVQLGDRSKLAEDTRHKQVVILPPRIPAIPQFNMPDMPSSYTSTLGAQVDSLTPQLGEYFGVKGGEGVLVKSVERGSAAAKAGLKAGDVIVRVAEERVSDRADLRHILRSHREGGKITLGIVRDKREQSLTVDLPARDPSDGSGAEIVAPDAETMEEIESAVEELGPEIDQIIQETVRPQVMAAAAAMKELKPELEKSMRQVQSEMEHLGKQLQKQSQEWCKDLDDLI